MHVCLCGVCLCVSASFLCAVPEPSQLGSLHQTRDSHQVSQVDQVSQVSLADETRVAPSAHVQASTHLRGTLPQLPRLRFPAPESATSASPSTSTSTLMPTLTLAEMGPGALTSSPLSVSPRTGEAAGGEQVKAFFLMHMEIRENLSSFSVFYSRNSTKHTAGFPTNSSTLLAKKSISNI